LTWRRKPFNPESVAVMLAGERSSKVEMRRAKGSSRPLSSITVLIPEEAAPNSWMMSPLVTG
jgi:hypothetical protein